MASQPKGSQSRRPASVSGGSANVGGHVAIGVNHPMMSFLSETASQQVTAAEMVNTAKGAIPKVQPRRFASAPGMLTDVGRQVVNRGNHPEESFPSETTTHQVNATGTVRTTAEAIPKVQKKATKIRSKRISVPVRRNPPRRVRLNPVSSCGLCNEPDNFAMVQCDECDWWYHFACVEVSQSVENISWSCPGCASVVVVRTPRAAAKSVPEIQQPNQNQQQQNPPPNVTASVKSYGKSSRRSEKRRIELQLQKLEEERTCQLKYLEEKYSLLQELESETSSLVSHPDSMLENATKVRQWIEDTEKCGDDSGLVDVGPENEPVLCNSSKPQALENSNQEQPVDDGSEIASLLRELLAVDRRAPPACAVPVMNSSNAVSRPILNKGSGAERGMSAPRRNSETIVEMLRQFSERIVPPADQRSRRTTPSNFPEETIANQREPECRPNVQPGVCAQQEERRETGTFTGGLNFIPGQGSTPVAPVLQQQPPMPPVAGTFAGGLNFVSGQGSTPVAPVLQPRPSIPPVIGFDDGDTTHRLNRSQLAARQAVSKDLPDFNGNPEDWPLFFSIFNSSSQLCGFSNEENMLRLRKCLRGKALEAVKCRMLHPSNVQGVMDTLKMLYGRPETIIQAIVRKIRALPSPNIERLDTVIQFALSVENLVATVEACEIGDFIYNASLRYELVERLPPTLKLDWARNSRNTLNPNLLDFSSWLRFIAEDASAVSISAGSDNRFRSSKKDGFLNHHAEEDRQQSEKPSVAQGSNKPFSKDFAKACPGCKGSCSSLAECKRFKELSYDSRWAVIREFNVCRKCLRKHYGPCKQKKACGVNGCTYLHHSLLHSEARKSTTTTATPSTPTPQAPANTSCNVHQGQSEILFRFVPVLLHGPAKSIRTYAFVDDGSELTLMEQSLADELGVQGPTKPLCLRWTSGANRTESLSQKVNFQISSILNPSKKFPLHEVHTVRSLQLRPQTLQIPQLQEKYRHLGGLPVESYEEVSPRLLIGLDHASLGNAMKSREGKPNEPIAVKTRLGWMIYGCCCKTNDDVSHVNHHSVQLCQCETDTDQELHEAMKKYFSLESLGISKPEKLLLSKDDQRANELLATLTTRKNGRYESGLLWRYDNVRLPDSRAMALRRWECLYRRMQKDKNLAQAMNAKMQEYLTKGYIRKLTKEELEMSNNRVWYLPIFPVVNPNKPKKIRVVWDAAASCYGVSLNSVLLKGPDLLASLLSVLVRFREFRVAVSGDLREMYHQVLMRLQDQHCLRFFWKENPDDATPSVYVLQVMSFGACCSPSTAQYVKNTHAKQFEQEYPNAVDAIIHQHYVDDMLISAETEEEAILLATDVKKIHESGGFEMRNWISNSPAVVAALDGEGTNEKNLSIGEAETTGKVLGMWWDTKADYFTYKVSARHDAELLAGNRRPTKREVLRTLMMVFDPLGLISHFLMFLRSLLQEIWRASVDWDEEIHDCHFEKWLTWLRILPQVSNVKIPRCYRIATSAGENTVVQMHTFVDASENGFAAVVYLRFQEGSTVECSLAGAKTRVAPLKFLSIPRSELQTAVIGVRLADSILASLSIKVQRRYFWTDARDVMCWLHSDHRRYSQFVGVRISEILESTEIKEWRWVPTKLNVADDGTKWKGCPDLSASSRWFCGPDFLRNPEEDWPTTSQIVKATDTELRPHLHLHFKAFDPIIDASRFSKWTVLLKTTAYVFRAIKNMQRSFRNSPKAHRPFSRDEFIMAESYLYQVAQRSTYMEEIAILSTKLQKPCEKPIPKSSSLYRLCPIMDEKGILRIRGRTNACQFIDSSIANPVILPRDHHITRLIVLDVHQRFLHQNHETIVNELKQRFYIPHLKAVYKLVRNSCQTCKNEGARPQAPLMSDLPPARLAAYSRPFSHMGVDYFGPMTVSIGRRTEKRWGVLVTCLTVRAIHLEVAHSLTTDSCIMALRNVMGRRGVPVAIYSDHGTNFVGAKKELQAALEQLDHDRIVAEFTSSQTTWHFIPPMSPHMGGAWERLIRTVKQNLEKLLPSRLPSDETLRSMLIEVESIVNSRPLTEIPLGDDQSPVLTPNHFIMGSSNGMLPWTCFDDNPTRLRQNWRMSQSLADQFWKQWLHDYLPSLTRRAKWFTEAKPIKVNDIVIIVDARFPRNCWPKGRVIATNVAPDGQVRWATVQTAKGIYERPSVKLAVLDVGVGGNATQMDLRCIEGGSVARATSTSEPSPSLVVDNKRQP
ncbi:uncharacterized protein LOC129752749 [Uranotaenia lowii]|uniref:uncharacterized protein LOC129752749 n=1 Tax=Uranotaenia lowii TaxID=190385 RepID=UPI00247A3D70|nr:uncharacterized protein LOC129752749 [Uranotaenia lowii]